MNVERTWYETSPYLYAGIAIISVAPASGSSLMRASAVILLLAALTIMVLRWSHRRRAMRSMIVPIDQARYVALITQDLFYDADHTRRAAMR